MAAPTPPADPSSAETATSEIVNKIVAFLEYLEDFETAVPLWEQSVAADPTIGDGTLTVYYQLVGKTLRAMYLVVAGSTTSFSGSTEGNWATLNLPEGSTVTGDKQRQGFTGVIADASTGDVYGCHTDFVDSTKFRVVWTDEGLSSSEFWAGDNPFDFDAAAGNAMAVSGIMVVD